MIPTFINLVVESLAHTIQGHGFAVIRILLSCTRLPATCLALKVEPFLTETIKKGRLLPLGASSLHLTGEGRGGWGEEGGGRRGGGIRCRHL